MDRTTMLLPENAEEYKAFIKKHPLIAPFGKRKEFVVKKANIVDDDRKKCHPGEKASLSKKMADHYNRLGLLVVDIPDFDADDVHEENQRLKAELEEAKNGAADNGEGTDTARVAEGEGAPEEARDGLPSGGDGGELSSGPVVTEEPTDEGKPKRRRRKASVE